MLLYRALMMEMLIVYEYESSCTSGMQWTFQSRLEKICYIVTMEFAHKLSVLVPMTSYSSCYIYMVHYLVHFIDELNQHAYKYQIKSNWEK